MLTGFEASEAMLRVKTGSWAELGADARRIRTEVFVQEQRIPAELEWDEADETAVHAVGYNRMGRAVATGRLLPSRAAAPRSGAWRCTRCCAAAASANRSCAHWRRGRRSAATAPSNCARAPPATSTRLGFVPQGEPFEEAGIPHIAMTSALPLRR